MGAVWCGFHYGVDSVFGCLVGGGCCVVGVWVAKNTCYTPPQCDDKYQESGPRLPVQAPYWDVPLTEVLVDVPYTVVATE